MHSDLPFIPGPFYPAFNPSEKYESQLGWFFPIYGNTKFMFQTTTRFYPFSQLLRYVNYIHLAIDRAAFSVARRSLLVLLIRGQGMDPWTEGACAWRSWVDSGGLTMVLFWESIPFIPFIPLIQSIAWHRWHQIANSGFFLISCSPIPWWPANQRRLADHAGRSSGFNPFQGNCHGVMANSAADSSVKIVGYQMIPKMPWT